MDPHPLNLFSYTTWDFKSLSKDEFRVGRHDLNFRVLKTTCILLSFFNLLAMFWVRLPLNCRKIVGVSEDLVLFFDALLVLFSIGLYRHLVFFLESASLFLKNNPLDIDFWYSKFCSFQEPDRSQPIRGCNKNPMNSPLNHFFYMLKRFTAVKNHYYFSVSWFLIPMTADITFAAHIYFNVTKSQIPFHFNFF